VAIINPLCPLARACQKQRRSAVQPFRHGLHCCGRRQPARTRHLMNQVHNAQQLGATSGAMLRLGQ